MIFHPWTLGSKPQNLRSLDIASWIHVFLQKDTVRAPLTPPYTGPYRVLTRTDKLFTLDECGKKETVSIDRVKRAFTYTDTQELHIPPHIHFAPANARCTLTMYTTLSPTCHHNTLSIDPRIWVKQYARVMNIRLFCWLVFFRLLTWTNPTSFISFLSAVSLSRRWYIYIYIYIHTQFLYQRGSTNFCTR